MGLHACCMVKVTFRLQSIIGKENLFPLFVLFCCEVYLQVSSKLCNTMTLFLCKPFSNLMAGILPFGAVFIELFFILSVSKLDFSIKKCIFVGPEKNIKIIIY